MEAWKPIPSLDHNYEASGSGEIRRSAPSRGTKQGRILAQGALPAGYKVVSVQLMRRTATRLVHRLVAEAFLGSPPDGYEVNHINSVKDDNRIENLEYVTRSQNLLHAVEQTGAYRGERNSQATITEETVREIRRMHSEGMGYKRLAKHFGVSWGLARGVASGRCWSHVK